MVLPDPLRKSFIPHVAVCICTFRRQALLQKVLDGLEQQTTDNRFTFSIVVCDNDSSESARSLVTQFANQSQVAVEYVVEPQEGIARARNRAVAAAGGDYIAFLDDDEIPEHEWLLSHFETCSKYEAAGTLGATLPVFATNTPAWIVKGAWYRRRRHRTGTVMDWTLGRTGNTLLSKRLFPAGEVPFNPAFISGEDQDFFRRQIAKGHRFVWCDEAVTKEIISASRWTARYLIRRSLIRGKMTAQHPTIRWFHFVKSSTALLIYCVLAPLFFPFSRHKSMEYFIKIFDHAGLLLGALGVDPTRQSYAPRERLHS